MPPSPVEKQSWLTRYSKGDLTLAAAGVGLAVICALFPWYIFYNQEQFGIRALNFEGSADSAGGAGLAPRSRLLPEPMSPPEFAPAADDARFDTVATGTVTDSVAKTPPPGVDEQPFPSRPGDFRLLHVANGRGMIEDDRGIWIVQRGSTLPDNSRVSSIEKRDGRWVLVTDKDRVVAMSD
jgi:hypothetical protein